MLFYKFSIIVKIKKKKKLSKMSKSCQKVVQSCQKVVKKNGQKLSKSCQKLSKSFQKTFNFFSKLSKTRLKFLISHNPRGNTVFTQKQISISHLKAIQYLILKGNSVSHIYQFVVSHDPIEPLKIYSVSHT
jgi:hypothetical protein